MTLIYENYGMNLYLILMLKSIVIVNQTIVLENPVYCEEIKT